jgi:two-component system chemotaxis response regulator CheB
MLNSDEHKLRVLIIDDSSFMRMAIRNILSSDPGIEVVATAADGVEGTAKAALFKPDIITMDLEMPRMDGITAVRQIMATTPTRVLMVSSLTRAGASATFEALEAGAVDYVPKNTTDTPATREQFRTELLSKIRDAGNASYTRKSSPAPVVAATHSVERVHHAIASRRVNYIGIGASTGGPTAVLEVLARLPASFPHAVLVAIHMPKTFTGPYAERLNNKCPLQVKEAADGDILKPGLVLIAPGGSHTTLVRQADGIAVRLSPTSAYPRYHYVPSVDLMMSSLAEAVNGSMLGVILTGMGNDGLKGMQHLKSKGGITLVQDEATSAIFGMPRACIEGGIADTVLPLEQIGLAIEQISVGGNMSTEKRIATAMSSHPEAPAEKGDYYV